MKKMQKFFLVTALAVSMIAASCGGSGSKKEWAQADQDAFLTNCKSNAQKNPDIDADKYCSCMLGKIMEKYPKADDASKMTMDEMMEMAKGCM
jgi:ABC-type phosphate/phosphonate transport system substrate-binding protein